jgi:hypothetical protein
VQAYCHPANANSVAASGAALSSTGGYGSASSGLFVSDTPNQPGILFTGLSNPGGTPFGCGQRCVGGSVVRYGPFQPVGNNLSTTIDMSLSANSRVQWWYRDPSNQAACGDTHNLSNALVQ